jgi:hypothetical protein
MPSSANPPRVMYIALWCSIVVASIIGLVATYSLRCELIDLMPEAQALRNPPNGIRFIHRVQALALVSPDFLSYEESRELAIQVAGALHIADLRICRSMWWCRHKESLNGLIFAFGDTWTKAVAMERGPGTLFVIGPRAAPPTDYPGQDLVVVLGRGAMFEQSNALWSAWCKQRGIVLVEAKGADVSAVHAAIVDAEKEYAALLRKRMTSTP